MREWTTAVPDWETRIVEGRSLIPFAPLFPEEAEAAISVFKSLIMVDAPGSPTFGEACDPWVFDLVGAVFGSYDHKTAIRHIREYFICVSKKNSKSTLAAGIMLTALIRNWRHSAELLILAPTIEVANNSFKPASDMVKADPVLLDLLHVQTNLRTIRHRLTEATLKVVSADNDTVSGKKAAFVLIDELWLFGKKANADAMLREATGGLVSRPEGFVISLSTQSDAPPAGVFKAKLDYFRDVRDGVVEDRKSLGVIYEFPKAMVKSEAYLDPKNFYITNPNMGRSVSQEWLEDEMRKELAKDGDTRRTFLAKHLNVEIGINLRANRWSGAEFWEARVDASLDLDTLLERSEVCVIGLDGGGLDDLFGFTIIGRERDTKHWLSWSHAWCHEGVLDRRKSIAPRLLDFAAADYLTIVGDELDDISEMVEIIDRVKSLSLLAAVSVDPAGIGEMVDALATIGVTADEKNLIGAPQGWGLMNAIKATERKLASGTFYHAQSGLMDWCVGNLKIEPTATGIRATKQTAGDAKIDPVMALFDAVVVMSTNPEPIRTRSVYEDRGLVLV